MASFSVSSKYDTVSLHQASGVSVASVSFARCRNAQFVIILTAFKIHESFQAIHRIPHLARLLRREIASFYCIDLRASSEHVEKTICKQIFARGGTIVLLDSMFLSDPNGVSKILHWVEGYLYEHEPYWTWKIVTRPCVKEWILRLAQERARDEGGSVWIELYGQR